MPFTTTEFPGLLVFDPVLHQDDRGYFFESYNEQVWTRQGISICLVESWCRPHDWIVRKLSVESNPSLMEGYRWGYSCQHKV